MCIILAPGKRRPGAQVPMVGPRSSTGRTTHTTHLAGAPSGPGPAALGLAALVVSQSDWGQSLRTPGTKDRSDGSRSLDAVKDEWFYRW